MTLATTSRYDDGAVSEVGRRAVVVGASMAGLCAARVLTDGFREVVVIERDPIPEEPSRRDGAPQTSHPHALLEAGRATLEDLFPGFGEDLLSAGGLLIDAASELMYYDEGGYLADPPERLAMYCATRPLIEHVVRRRVASLDGVRLRGACQVTDYLVDDAGETITGVAVREGGERATLTADLVVDASGRTSRTPRWLERNGYPTPAVDEVEIGVTYGTIRIERPPDDRRVLLATPDAPRTRGGVAIPAEGDTWEVILQGVHGDDVPTDREGLVAFAESLPIDDFGRIVRERPWVSEEIHHYPFPSSRRVRYEGLDRFPDGLVVTGDAIASFNPVYGQGMSVAALDALLLHHALAEEGVDDLARRFFDRTAEVVDVVWKLAVGADFEFPETAGPKPTGTDLFNRYVSRLIRRAHSDPVLADAFYRVLRLEEPPTALLRPGIVARTLFPFGSGGGRPSTGSQPTGD